MATRARTSSSLADRIKWSFAAVMGVAFLLVLSTDERFWFNPADPHWNHIDPVKYLLMLHGLAGVTALTTGAFQMSSRIRRLRPAFHRALGKVYIGAVTVAAPLAFYVGTSALEPVTIHVQQFFMAPLWWLCTVIAWACIRNGQVALHKPWMMRSYGLTLIFILSRVPDAFMDTSDPQFLSDLLWSLTLVALIAPDVILTSQTLWKIRSAKARHAAQVEQLAAAE